MINILITVNHCFELLKPLSGEEPVSGLTVAGKSVLEHLLEAIVKLDINQITIAASGDVMGLRSLISDGKRWGITAKLIPVRTNESPYEIYKRNSHIFDSDLIIVPCDGIFISSFTHIESVLKQHSSAKEGIHCGHSGITFIPLAVDICNIRCKDLTEIIVHKIHDVAGYHAANLAAVEGTLGALKISGRQVAVGLRQGYMSRCHPRSVHSGHVYVGNHCRIHSTCKISGPVMINHGVSIDRMTIVENSVILENTIIGEHLHVRNAVVSGNTIVRVDNGAVVELSDKHLITERGEGFFSEYVSALLNRCAGVLIFILTLPVLITALLAQFIRSPASVLTQRVYVGNKTNKATQQRDVFVTHIIDNPDSKLRCLPMVLDIIKGNANVFGVSLLTPEEHECRNDEWQKITENSPVGLLGPTQLYLGLDAPLNDKLLSDAMSSRSGTSVSGFIELLLRCMQRPFSNDRVKIN